MLGTVNCSLSVIDRGGQNLSKATIGKKLNIVYLAGTLLGGGAERELVNQVKVLKRAGHNVVVLTLVAGEAIQEEIEQAGVKVIYVGLRQAKMLRLLKIIHFCRQMSPDIIHSQHFHANLYAMLAGKITNVVAVGSIQNDLYSEIRNTGLLGTASFKILPWLTANSKPGLTNLLASGYPEDRAFYLPNAVDLEIFDQKKESLMADFPWDQNRPVVMAVGRLVPQKRYDRFLRILRDIKAAGLEVQGVIAGGGPLQSELMTLSRNLGIDNDVMFLGHRHDVPGLLAQADIFLLSSDHEGMPNVVQEAMAANLPVVASMTGAVPDLVLDGTTGFIIPPHNEDDFASKIISLLRNEELRKKFGKAGRRRAEDEFSLEKLAKTLDNIYHSILLNN